MYYPKSQIKTNLYTNGGKYVIKSTQEDYKGFFYQISTGKLYVGKSPQGRGEIEISLPLIDTEDTEDYTKPKLVRVASFFSDADPSALSGEFEGEVDSIVSTVYSNVINSDINLSERDLPKSYVSTPTQQERLAREYRRYFAKKTNQPIYVEISKETYTKFLSQDPTTAFDVYEVLLIPWALSQNGVVGDPLPPETINRNIVALAEKNNDWYGFTSYFKGNFSPTITLS